MRDSMNRLTWGVELETYGLGIAGCAAAVARATGGRIVHEGGYYQKSLIVLADGRKWTVLTDGSITGGSGAEVVSPICKMGDMDMVQAIVRELRAAGAKVNDSCGLHVHVGADQMGPAGVRQLVMTWNRFEEHLMLASGGRPGRMTFAKPTDPAFAQTVIGAGHTLTDDALNQAWYGRSHTYDPRRSADHYNMSRYRALNLHAMWWHGTVEFRCWDATLHAGKVRAAIVASVAMAAYSVDASARNCRTAHQPLPSGPGTGHLWAGFLTGWLKISKKDNVFGHLMERHIAAGWCAGERVNGRGRR